MDQPLGVGLVGSGFIANFHAQSWVGVRGADIVAIHSRNHATASALADRVRALGVGDPTTTDDLVALVRDPKVDAIWMTAPNHVRVEMIETICEEVASGRAELVGIAIEKPLARTWRRRSGSSTRSRGRGSSAATSRTRCSRPA
jgi:predicted dehydrogenase